MTVPQRPRIFIHSNAQGGFDVLCRIPHAMSDDKYLTQVTFRHNDVLHAEVLLGRYVSADPVIGTSFGALTKGDEVLVSWQDIAGQSNQLRRVFDGNTD